MSRHKESRQEERRLIFRASFKQVNQKNLWRSGSHGEICRGMQRAERRKLARAYAAKWWTNRKAERAAA